MCFAGMLREESSQAVQQARARQTHADNVNSTTGHWRGGAPALAMQPCIASEAFGALHGPASPP